MPKLVENERGAEKDSRQDSGLEVGKESLRDGGETRELPGGMVFIKGRIRISTISLI